LKVIVEVLRRVKGKTENRPIRQEVAGYQGQGLGKTEGQTDREE